MIDEVKHAAERLRAGSYSLHDEDEYFMSSRKFEDMGILADAYLDEHDPETAKGNATLLTAEILRASGFGRGIDFRWRGAIGICPRDGRVMVGEEVIGRVKTVGDLRKLLEALHIDAVVVVPKGGE